MYYIIYFKDKNTNVKLLPSANDHNGSGFIIDPELYII